jgi:hypothetical protein
MEKKQGGGGEIVGKRVRLVMMVVVVEVEE